MVKMNYKEYINYYTNYLSITLTNCEKLTVYFADCNSSNDDKTRVALVKDVSGIIWKDQTNQFDCFLFSVSPFWIDDTVLNKHKKLLFPEFPLFEAINISVRGKLIKLYVYNLDSQNHIELALNHILLNNSTSNFLIGISHNDSQAVINNLSADEKYYELNDKNNNVDINIDYLLSQSTKKVFLGYGSGDFGQYVIVGN
jgi:hypothetical protein